MVKTSACYSGRRILATVVWLSFLCDHIIYLEISNRRPLPWGKRNPTPWSHRREALMAISDAHQFGGVARNASRSTCFRALPLRSGIITVQIPTSLISFPQFSENFCDAGRTLYRLCLIFIVRFSRKSCSGWIFHEHGHCSLNCWQNSIGCDAHLCSCRSSLKIKCKERSLTYERLGWANKHFRCSP